MTDLYSAHAPELIFDTHLKHFDRAEILSCLQCARRETPERTDRQFTNAGRCDYCNP